MNKKFFKAIAIVGGLLFFNGCVVNKNIAKEDNIEEGTDKEKGTIKVISDFYSPELDTENTVRIYLPPDYDKGEKRYPVIYMLDGQNLFDPSTATYRKAWLIADRLDNLYYKKRTTGIIVVGVDSLESRRTKEYNLYLKPPEVDKGKAKDVSDFYANTLKQYIDKNYRTLEDREHTAIIGASYGAVVSICSSINYPKVYGYTGMFSYCDNQNPEKMREYLKNNFTPDILTDNKVYFYTGENDFANESTKAAYEVAKENGVENILYVTDEGDHDELSWGSMFENCLEFFKWLK